MIPMTNKGALVTTRKRGRRRRRRKSSHQSPPQKPQQAQKENPTPSGDVFGLSHYEDYYLYNVTSPDFATCNWGASARNIDPDVLLTSTYLRDIISQSVSNQCLSRFIMNYIVSKIMLFHQNKTQVLLKESGKLRFVNDQQSDANDSAALRGCDIAIDFDSGDDFVAFNMNELELDLELGIPSPAGSARSVDLKRSRSIGSSAYSVSESPSTTTEYQAASPSTSTGTTFHPPQTHNPYSSMDIKEIIHRKLELYELVEHRLVYRMMRDQFGSRYLQNMIKSLSVTHRQSTHHISLLIDHLTAERVDLCLMSEDIYGNYLVQLLFVYGDESHHEFLLSNFVYKSMLRLCQSRYGCRVIQKILSSVKNTNQLVDLVQSFEEQTVGKMRTCLLCCNTNHVIQAIIGLKLPKQHLKFVKDALEKRLVDYSDNVYACRVVQAFIKAYGDELDVGKLCVNDNHLLLARSKYGNYVIQCILTKEEWYSNLASINKIRNRLISDVFVAGNVLFLSKDKFGSNVIETAIEVSNEKQLDILINAVCSKQGFLLKQMIPDKFGNYVPKTLLDNCRNTRQQMKLVNTVHSYITNLYTRHRYRNCSGFIQKCQRIYMDGTHYLY
eukprot:1048049_1